MAQNYILLETIELTQSAASVTFDNIPQTGYTDLVLKVSCRSDQSNVARSWKVQPNGVDITARNLDAENNPFVAFSGTSRNMNTNGTGSTANSFNNYNIYIPNYASTTTYKSLSVDGAVENNGTDANLKLFAGLYSSNTAISSITCIINAGSFVQHSTFSLYGVADVNTTPVTAPFATGGNIVANDGTYWYHAFLTSGTFTPQTALTCDLLVIAGGGGGGKNVGGGGGAGGLQTSTSTNLTPTAYVVTVGGGGAGGGPADIQGISGSNSIFSSVITSTGGGGGGGAGEVQGLNGGSGGGSSYNGNIAGGLGTAGQGNNGGSSIYFVAGGGGGAGGVGANATGSGSGAGGIGATSSLINAFATATSTGVYSAPNYYYAGGGGGGGYTPQVDGAGGIGGGGAGGGTPTAGTRGTGGGGGGNAGGSGYGPNGASGGSGIVIIRYAMA
jgi:hypothetical protein